MKEILKLKSMLEKAAIPFRFLKWEQNDTLQICYPDYNPERAFSVIQGKNSYGGKDNLLEIQVQGASDVEGWLTAEEVFKRIKKHYEQALN